MTLDETAEVVQRWSASTNYVAKAWLYGSRMRGDNRPDSDIDVAIQVLKGNIESPYTRFLADNRKWRAFLQEHLPWIVHLTHYDETDDDDLSIADGNVKKAVDQYGRLVFDRSAASSSGSTKPDT